MHQATMDVLRKHAAAYPSIISTSSQTATGIAELRAEIARIVNIRAEGTITRR
jgi:selenocysteine-specific translation elongation factor